jgi:hypothetical protein
MTQYTTRFFRQRHRPRGVAPGYVVHGRWPIEPVVMFDGPNAIPGFFANGDIYYSLGQRPRNRASHVIPYSFSQGRCPWLWCAWPLANPTGRDVRWPKCDTRFFSPKAIFIIAWGNAPGIGRATLSHIHFPRGDAPGYVVLGRWPIEPFVMFDGANATPGFFRQRRYFDAINPRRIVHRI